MGLFDNFTRKKRTKLNSDQLQIRFEIEPEFLNSHQATVDELIASISHGNEIPLQETQPFGTFVQVEAFFQALKEHFPLGNDSQDVPFKYLGVWSYDQQQKFNPGQNPEEYFDVPHFTLAYDYQNLTKVLFEEVFNDPANADVPLTGDQSKMNVCDQVSKAYQQSTGCSLDDIAKLPTEEEAQNRVSLNVPSFVGATAKSTPASSESNSPTYDPNSGDLSNYHDQSTNSENVPEYYTPDDTTDPNAGFTTSTPLPVPSFSNPETTNDNQSTAVESRHNSSMSTQPGTTRNEVRRGQEIQAEVNDQKADVAGLVELTAPQYDVLDLETKEPGESGYVEYQLNERKKKINAHLRQIAQYINDQNAKTALARRGDYDEKIQNELKHYVAEANKGLSSLQADVQAEMQTRADQEREQATNEIDQQEEQEKSAAKRRYEEDLANINQSIQTLRSNREQEITNKYDQLAEDTYNERYQAKTDQIKSGQDKLHDELSRKYDLAFEDDLSTMRLAGTDQLQKVFDEGNADLEQLEPSLIAQQLNGKQTMAAQQRAENEKIRLEAPYQEVQQLQNDKAELARQLSVAQSRFEAATKQNDEKTAMIKELQDKNDNLTKMKISESQLASASQIQNQNEKTNKTLTDFVQLMIADRLKDGHSSNDEATQEREAQFKRILRGAKVAIVSLIVALVLVIGSGITYIVHENHQNSQQITQLQKQLSKASSKTSTKTAADKASTTNTAASTVNPDSGALKALHDNSLEDLNKYSSETYYDLDKAIINNDKAAVYNAVCGLSDLNLKDQYRTIRTIQLLQDYGYYGLAQDVQNAND